MPDKGKKDKKSVKGKSGKKRKDGESSGKKAKSASKNKAIKRGKSSKKRDDAKRKTDAVIVAESAIDPAERFRMIAEAAYYRSLARDHDSGCPEQDWTEAEREIDRQHPVRSEPAD